MHELQDRLYRGPRQGRAPAVGQIPEAGENHHRHFRQADGLFQEEQSSAMRCCDLCPANGPVRIESAPQGESP